MSSFSDNVTRRDFVKSGCALALLGAFHSSKAFAEEPQLHEALYYDKEKDGSVQCRLCPNGCALNDKDRGICKVRENRGGKLYTLVHSRPCAINTDPIEKKPFFHVYPGSKAYSIATAGCNLSCKFCQNWDISQTDPDKIPAPNVTPEMIAQNAKNDKQKPKTVAYTYSEPTVFYEYMMDCMKKVKEAGLGNIVVSNGFINEKPLKELCKAATAIKIDFKAFSDKFYEETCSGKLQPVLKSLKTIKDSGTWLEIVNLVIPTLNDNIDEISKMADWIVKELGQDVPVHFTRFHPAYKLKNLPDTPVETLHKARTAAMKAGCNYVYTGNMPGGEGDNTFCPKCKTLLVERYGMLLIKEDLKDNKCAKCQQKIPGLWN